LKVEYEIIFGAEFELKSKMMYANLDTEIISWVKLQSQYNGSSCRTHCLLEMNFQSEVMLTGCRLIIGLHGGPQRHDISRHQRRHISSDSNVGEPREREFQSAAATSSPRQPLTLTAVCRMHVL